MFELEILKLLVKRFMLADLAHIVLSIKDTHATCNARREMTATLLATDIKFIDNVVTLWTVKLLHALVIRWISGEQVDGKELIGLSFLLGDGVQPL